MRKVTSGALVGVGGFLVMAALAACGCKGSATTVREGAISSSTPGATRLPPPPSPSGPKSVLAWDGDPDSLPGSVLYHRSEGKRYTITVAVYLGTTPRTVTVGAKGETANGHDVMIATLIEGGFSYTRYAYAGGYVLDAHRKDSYGRPLGMILCGIEGYQESCADRPWTAPADRQRTALVRLRFYPSNGRLPESFPLEYISGLLVDARAARESKSDFDALFLKSLGGWETSDDFTFSRILPDDARLKWLTGSPPAGLPTK